MPTGKKLCGNKAQIIGIQEKSDRERAEIFNSNYPATPLRYCRRCAEKACKVAIAQEADDR